MPYLKYDKIYDEQNMQNAYIIFRKHTAENQLGGKENFHKFFSRLEFVEEKTYSGNRLNESVQIYKAKGDIFYRGSE